MNEPHSIPKPAARDNRAAPQAASEPASAKADVPVERVRRRIPAVAVTGLFVLATFYTFYFARDILLPIVLAALLTLVLTPVMRVFIAIRIPAPVGAAIVVAGVLATLGVGASLLIQPASEWMARAPETLNLLEKKLRTVRRSVEEVSKAAAKVENIAAPEDAVKAKRAPPPKPTLTSRILGGAQKVLLVAAPTVVLLYFLLATGDLFLRKLVKVLPTLSDKKRAVTVAHTVQDEMAIYLFTITCINAGLGVATGIAMYFLGMPNPALWGVMVALFNYVPYLGPLMSLIVLTVVAATSFESLGQTLAVPAVFFTLTFLEGQILMPFITGRRLTLNPVVIFLSMLLWGWLWGVIGMLIAVPIAMIVRIVCEHVEWLKPFGEFLSSERTEMPEQDHPAAAHHPS
ncbi:MAG TPA: AI-2E family transporter [Burkholderiales bacterium]|nr:AI-2E family transporter [Burkholderiales bacterium]